MRCTFVAIAQLTAQDRDTNNISLFALAEQIQLDATRATIPPGSVAFPTIFTAVCMFRLELEEIDQRFDVRLACLDATDAVVHVTEVTSWTMTKRRMRLKIVGIDIPIAPGVYRYFPEWRHPGAEPWTRGSSYWELMNGETYEQFDPQAG